MATFLEYFHVVRMCQLSTPLGKIRLGAEQKRIFLTRLIYFFFVTSRSKSAKIYSLAVYDDTEIRGTSENYTFLQWLGPIKLTWQNKQWRGKEVGCKKICICVFLKKLLLVCVDFIWLTHELLSLFLESQQKRRWQNFTWTPDLLTVSILLLDSSIHFGCPWIKL